MPTSAELRAQATAARDAARAAKEQADALAAAACKAELEERRAKTAAESAAHYARMYDEIGQPLAGLNKAQHGIVYSQAREQASGYDEVESYYGEFAEMARKILDAN
jgi:membrane protein involved in colicin uptake